MVKDLALPDGVVIAMIARGDQIILPQGQTEISIGDHVILVMRQGIQAMVNQIFGNRGDQSPIASPATLEFPLRPTTTVGNLKEFYALEIDGPVSRTLEEVMVHELGNLTPQVGEIVRIGPVLLRIMRLSVDQKIELIGLSIVPLRPDLLEVSEPIAHELGKTEPVSIKSEMTSDPKPE